MFQRDAFLEKVHINSFLSFKDVELLLKPLTVLVGPNASGKSNVLEVLHLLNWSMVYGQFPNIFAAPDSPLESQPLRSTFQFTSKVKQTPVVYDLALESMVNDASVDEESSLSGRDYLPMQIVEEGLLVNDVEVISTLDGQFMLRDENGKNKTRYKSDALALKAAGDYGFKPITSALAEFIKRWEFHNFEPKLMPIDLPRPIPDILKRYESGKFTRSDALPTRGRHSLISALLSHWHDNDSTRFNRVSKALSASANLTIKKQLVWGVDKIYLLDGSGKSMPLEAASDGTLRLIIYYIMLNDPEPPPLIAIEEPEQSLHPGALNAIADLLEQLAECTQVIITTHSSQLLDVFDPERLSDSLGILLLRNPQGRGTEVINLEDIRGNRPALDGWITDFGIGSAIFDSELLGGPTGKSE